MMNKKRVILEPELETQAALWTPKKRRAMAVVFERWARQLRVSAFILERAQLPQPPPRRPRLLQARKLVLN